MDCYSNNNNNGSGHLGTGIWAGGAHRHLQHLPFRGALHNTNSEGGWEGEKGRNDLEACVGCLIAFRTPRMKCKNPKSPTMVFSPRRRLSTLLPVIDIQSGPAAAAA